MVNWPGEHQLVAVGGHEGERARTGGEVRVGAVRELILDLAEMRHLPGAESVEPPDRSGTRRVVDDGLTHAEHRSVDRYVTGGRGRRCESQQQQRHQQNDAEEFHLSHFLPHYGRPSAWRHR
jgi:hypothetical protein